MFCPSCGERNNLDQKFCRKCGLNLEQTALSVREQSADTGPADLRREEQLLEKFGKIAFTGFGIVIGLAVLGIIYTIVVTFILNGSQPLAGIIFVAFIVFAALSLAYVFWNESIKEKRARIETAPGRVPAEPRRDDRLTDGADFEPVPSVIEDTTSLLSVERKTKELE